MAEPSSLLSPAVVAAIDDLELAARVVVEGLRVGGHRSPFHGYGADFQQHRPYRAGDDLKYLDWKVYARSNRLYTRQFRETTNVSVMFVLDTSASMAFAPGGISKLRYASIVTAALAYLASEQGNAVGCMTMTDGNLAYLPARSGRGHLRSLLARIDGLTAAGAWQPATVIGRAAELLQRRGLIGVSSDFYDDEKVYLESRILESGDVVLLAFGGHGFEMLEASEIIEVKQGPYAGDADKTRFAPIESVSVRVVK